MIVCLYVWTISFIGCSSGVPTKWDVLAEDRNKAIHTAQILVADFDKNSACGEVVGIQRGDKLCFWKGEEKP